MIGYIRRHWQGEQSLALSFWINLVAIRVIVFLAQNALAPIEDHDYHHYQKIIFLLIVVFHFALLIWQLVGVVRAAENHFAKNGNMALVWGAQLGGVLMLVLSAIYALGAVQMSMPVTHEIDVHTQLSQAHTDQYELRVSENADVLFIKGRIEPGITRSVKSVLQDNPGVHTVVLDSHGGNIYEGRGLARVFSDTQLHTHVSSSCASACTIAFVGGVSRSAHRGASFGFHQYRVDADYIIIATDVEKEQSRDQQRLLDAGVSAGFADVVFSQPSTSMWWPELTELRDANFLHTITAEDSPPKQ